MSWKEVQTEDEICNYDLKEFFLRKLTKKHLSVTVNLIV